MSDTAGAIRRTAVFAAALIVLLVFARAGAAPLTIQAAFSVFVAIATIWLRGQYVDSLDNRQWVIPMLVGCVLVAIAALLFGIFVAVRSGGLAIASVLIAYFVAGSAMTELRQRDSVRVRVGRRVHFTLRPMAAGPWLTGVGVVLAIVGLVALGHGTGTGWLILEAILLALPIVVLLPIGLSLLSEWAMRPLSQEGRSRTTWRWGLGIGGAALFAAMTGLAVGISGSVYLLGAMVAIGLLVVAMVSSTHADIVAVMGIVALLGVTPAQTREPDRLTPDGGHHVLVALGDSYMSGEGASIYYEGTDEGGGDQCRRSPTSWAAMAAQLSPFDRLEFRACSGARTANVLPVRPSQPTGNSTRPEVGNPPPSAQPGEGDTQLDGYRADHLAADGAERFTPDLVVLSIGGNDAGFSTIGIMCMAPGNCSDKSALWTSSLDQVRARLRATYFEVDAAFPNTPVVIIPYPDPIALLPECGQVALSDNERRFIHRFLTGDGASPGLNDIIEETAQEYGFHYLAAMQNALANSHLQLCDPLNEGRPGLNFIGLRSVRGIAEQRFNPANWSHSSLHPNERGHAAMLRVFQTWLAEQPVIHKRLPVSTGAASRANAASTAQAHIPRDQADQTASTKAPQCDLFDPSPTGCRPQGQQWALQQVGRTLVRFGWVPLLAAGGAWAAAVALFSWRRQPWRYPSP